MTEKNKKVDISSLTAILIIFSVFILFFRDILYENSSLIYGDNLYVFLPFKEFLWESLRAFRIPHWTSLSSCGFPFLSIVFPGTFYLPDGLFFLIFPGYKALSLSLVFHLLLGALSLYAYMRLLKISPFSSMIAALVFSMNGFMIGHLHDYAIVVCAVWLPLVFYFIELAYRRDSFLFLFPAGIVLALQMFAGHIQPASYSLFASAFYLLCRSLSRSTEHGWPFLRNAGRTILWEIVMCGTAIGLAAIQLFPTMQFIALTNRAAGSDLQGMLQGSFHPLHFIGVIFPFFFGRQIPAVLTEYYWGKGFFWEFCPYYGILPFLLSLIPIFSRKDFYRKFFLFLFFMSFFLFLGPRIPTYELFFIFPKFQQFRIPAKALLLFVFSASVLAGFGMEKVLEPEADKKQGVKRWYRICSLLSLILIISLVAWNIFLYIHPAMMENLLKTHPLIKQEQVVETLRATTGLFNKNVLLSLGLLLFGLGTIRFGVRKRFRRKSFIFAVLVLVLLDFFLFSSSVRHRAEPFGEGYFKPQALNYLQDLDASFRFYTPAEFRPSPEKKNILTPNIHMIYGISSVWQAPRTNLRRFDEMLSLMKRNDFSAGSKNLFDLMAARYIVSLRPLEGESLIPLHEGAFYAYRNASAIPRASLVYKTRVVRDEKDILRILTDPDFNPAEEAVVEEDCMLGETTAGGKSDVSILADKHDLLQVSVGTSRRGLLVVSDVHYPGWQVLVDGKPGRMLRVNYAFRGVILPEGKHLVEFQFTSRAFNTAVVVSGFTGFFIIFSAAGVILWRKKAVKDKKEG